MKTNDERREYARGYNAGRSGQWPRDAPLPPDEKVQALGRAARALADQVDMMFAVTFDESERDQGNLAPLEAARLALLDAIEDLLPKPDLA